LLTLQREKRTFGYFSPKRFANQDGGMTDEIAMNPAFFAVVPLTETMQTLVHEMCHLWQYHFGKPGRGRYHNDEWANKMESIGLMPSSTGQPGGARTGDSMADYAMQGGKFLQACEDLLTQSFQISWYDRFPALEHVQAGQMSMAMQLGPSVGGGSVPAQANAAVMASLVRPVVAAENPTLATGGSVLVSPNKSNRSKYACPCKNQVWGKPGLKLICGDCRSAFEAAL
jgi:predicted SprT family Zn-dependent metalloprotease